MNTRFCEISDAKIAEYHRRGFISLGRFLSDDQLSPLRTAIDGFREENREEPGYGVLRHNVWQQLDSVRALINDTPMAAIAAAVLQEEEVILFQDNLVWKTPGAARIEWHQDYSYWPLDRPSGVTLWLALDAAQVANGCLHYLPGTQLLGERQPADFIHGSAQPPRRDLPPLDWESRIDDVIPVPAQAGELLLHHPLTWHMSPPNGSAVQRRALSLTWVSASVRWDPEHAPHPCNHELRPEAGSPLEGERFPRFSC